MIQILFSFYALLSHECQHSFNLCTSVVKYFYQVVEIFKKLKNIAQLMLQN